MKNDEGAFSSFWEHIEELRRTLIRVFLIIIVSMIVCFFCSGFLITFLKKPLISQSEIGLQHQRLEYNRIYNHDKLPQTYRLSNHSQFSDQSKGVEIHDTNEYLIAPGGSLVFSKVVPSSELFIMGPLEGILISFKLSLWMGIFLSCPLWLLVLSQFFLPGLHVTERRFLIPFLITSLSFIIMGCLFAFYITIPLANHYLESFNRMIGTNLWSLKSYLDYSLFLILANGVAFELGAIGLFAVHLQLISAKGLRANRRFAILGAFILATALTPPDVLTQLLLAIPLCLMYEALILYAKIQKTSN